MTTKLMLVRTDLENYVLNAIDPPLGILSLSSMVKQEFGDKVEVRVKDLRIKKENETTFKRDLLEWQPDIVGFSSLSAEGERTAYWTEFVKQIAPETTVIIGGPYVSMFPEESLQDTKADVAFMWEAELSLCEWLNCYIEKNPQKEAGGIVLWDENNSPYITAQPEIINDITGLPIPDWDAICFDDYYSSFSMNFINAHRRYTSIYTSRGCPFHCAYCHHTQGKKVRYRDINQVVDEIEYVYNKHGIREIQIVDDIFNINKERVFEFCRLLKERNIKIYLSFPNGLRGDADSMAKVIA